jgi:sugar phosphate isomerase/epimerase
MRLSVITDEVSQDPTRAIELCRRHGFDGIEVRSVWDTPPDRLSPWDCTRLRTLAAGAGLEICALASPAFKTALPKSTGERAAVRAGFERSVEIAQRLDAPIMRVFSFLRRDEPDPEAAAAEIARALETIELGGVDLVLETGTRTNTPDAETTLRLLETLRLDVAIGVLWDPGNSAFSGIQAKPFPDDYRLLRERLRHVHAKNPRGTEAYVAIDDGDLPWIEILRALARDGYSGHVSLETHWRPRVPLTQALRDVPHGSAFSRDGAGATDFCMGRLRQIVDGIPPRG